MQVGGVPDGILYQRRLPHGPEVRIRRTSDEGASPVVAVLEVDRRAGTARSERGFPPPLLRCEAASEADAMAALEPQARDDRRVVQLMRERGQR